jgi:hypothetical protein
MEAPKPNDDTTDINSLIAKTKKLKIVDKPKLKPITQLRRGRKPAIINDITIKHGSFTVSFD